MSINNKKKGKGKSEITGGGEVSEEGSQEGQEQLKIGGECQNKKGGVGGEMQKN